MSFDQQYEKYKDQVQSWLNTYMDLCQRSEHSLSQGVRADFQLPYLRLFEAINYSLLQGGKRFRPVLGLFVSESLNGKPGLVLPYLAAVEMIHTYSLIHDDLPCMDNDDFRRGQPTNHRVFGESCALLAGDALLTEAFQLISIEYRDKPQLGLELSGILARAAGASGMVGGQAIDLFAKGKLMDISSLQRMQAMKTGALIRAVVEGVSRICQTEAQKHKLLIQLGESFGLAFQLKDDLLDSQGGVVEKGSFPELLGLEQTEAFLLKLTADASKTIEQISNQGHFLHQILEMNLLRSQ